MKRRQDWLNLGLGLWLVFSPLFGFGEVTAASLNTGIVGMLVATTAMFSISRPHVWQEVVNFVLGVWLLLAPMALAFSAESLPTLNHVLVGTAVSLLALSAFVRRMRKRRAS